MQGSTRKINYCQSCGGPTKHEIPKGEEKMRAICTLCGKIAYENPKMVSIYQYRSEKVPKNANSWYFGCEVGLPNNSLLFHNKKTPVTIHVTLKSC